MRTATTGPGRRRTALPAGFGLVLDTASRRVDDGRVLIGGAPLRILRLSDGGRALVDALDGGAALDGAPSVGALARRLTDAGLAHPVPPPTPPPLSLALVVPVRDDPRRLRHLLRSLPRDGVGEVVVVDDGSADAGAIAAALHDRDADPDAGGGAGAVRLLRHPVGRGPAAARTTGAAATGADLIAFVDADVTLDPGWLAPLIAHFADPCVGAVAPRVVAARPGPASSPRQRAVATYEGQRSPLDLGPRPALVRPGGPVPFVPSAALVVRRTALDDVGGFDPAMTVGEDVDLVWRLHDAGWVVRYHPGVQVRHAVRPTLGSWARQRVTYGTSAAALAGRHPGALAPLRVSSASAAAWAAAGLGRPGVGLVLVGATTAALAPRLSGLRHPWREAARLAGSGHLLAGSAMATALRREWWPIAAVTALAVRRCRPAVAAAVLLPPAVRWARTRPGLSPVAWMALHLADDAAYGAGVWLGCLRQRTVAPLVPDLREWPGRRRAVEPPEEPPEG